MAVDDAIVMDQRTFKSLASESRVKMLKLLGERRHTLSEIAKALGISLANASEHLGKLEESNLVRQVDEGRKWKYYELTKDGKAIVASSTSPYPRSFVILLALSMLGLFASLFLFAGFADLGFRGAEVALQKSESQELIAGAAPQADGVAAEPMVTGVGVPTGPTDKGGAMNGTRAAENFTANASWTTTASQAGAGEKREDTADLQAGTKKPPVSQDRLLPLAFAIIFGASMLYCAYRLVKAKREKKLID